MGETDGRIAVSLNPADGGTIIKIIINVVINVPIVKPHRPHTVHNRRGPLLDISRPAWLCLCWARR